MSTEHPEMPASGRACGKAINCHPERGNSWCEIYSKPYQKQVKKNAQSQLKKSVTLPDLEQMSTTASFEAIEKGGMQ